MFIGGEVETAKLAQASDVIRATYEAYRSTPDLTSLSALRQSLADGTAHNLLHVNVAARMMLQLALDGRDPKDVPRFGELLASKTEKDVKERLTSVFPQGNNLIVVAASPNANALPGACVITQIEQAVLCK